jgi:hypothetical protein
LTDNISVQRPATSEWKCMIDGRSGPPKPRINARPLLGQGSEREHDQYDRFSISYSSGVPRSSTIRPATLAAGITRCQVLPPWYQMSRSI